MAIAYVGGTSQNGATITTMPSHSTDDLIIATVWRNGSTTPPTIPSGWNLGIAGTGTTAWLGIYYKVAASSSETSGTWTSATSIGIDVYSGATIPYAGGGATGTGTGTTITYPSQGFVYANDSTSWAFRAVGAKAATNIGTNTPTSHTARHALTTPTASAQRSCDQANISGTTIGTTTQTVTGSGVWVAGTLEIVAAATTPAEQTAQDTFNTGSVPDTGIWTTTTLSGGTTVLTSQRAVLAATSTSGSYSRMVSKTHGSLIGSFVAAQVFGIVGATAAKYFGVNGTSTLYWVFTATTAQAYSGITARGSSRTHTSGDWYRIRESGGTVYWDYSSDGITWSNQYNAAASTLATSGLVREFANVTTYSFVSNAASTALSLTLDNVNLPPGATNTNLFFVMF